MVDARQVFEILAREHADMLWAYLNSVVRDRAAAEDLFQETFLTAWRGLDRYDTARPFGPWLRGIAGKLILARRRKLARDLLLVDARDLEALEGFYVRIAGRPGDVWEEKLDLLRRCLNDLPEPQRTVVQLYYWDDLDCPGIAARLARPLESIKKRLQRARAALSDCIQLRLAASPEPVP